MRFVLFFLGLLIVALGLLLSMAAKSSIHEIYGAVLMLIGAVFISGAAVVEAIERLRRDMLAAASSGRAPPGGN